jgi:hypothetical protein
LLSTILHEYGHGLGFTSALNPDTGTFTDGATSFDYQAWDVTTTPAQSWFSSGPSGRKTLATTPAGVVLTGANMKKDIPRFLGFSPSLQLVFDGADAGIVDYVAGAFSGPLEGGGVLALTTPADGCAPLTSGPLTGKVALIRRGTCTFREKADRAADAGAIGLVVANNDVGLVQMAPAKPARKFPAVMVTQEVGNAIEAQVAKGTAAVRYVVGSVRSNANELGAYLYTPTAIEPGSSVSHFNTGSFPRALLMQPVSEPSTLLNLDLTASIMADMGWSVVNGLTVGVVKALEAPVTQGSENKYLVAVINRRTTAITSVGLEVSGPGSTSVVSYEGECTTVPCNLGEMASGATALVIVTLKAGANVTGDFAVTAKLTPSSADAEDNLSATVTQEVASGGDLTVTVTPPMNLSAGSDSVFTATVVNQGPSIATPVTLTLELKAADGSTQTLTGDCAAGCTLTQLAKDETYSVPSTFSVPKGFNQKVTFTATVTSGTPDADASNNTASTSAQHTGCSAVSGTEASLWLAAFVLLAMWRTRPKHA